MRLRQSSRGRGGNSSLIGCGCYADNETVAASATGWGEPIMKLVLAKWATDRVCGERSPGQAAAEAIGHLQHCLGGNGGIIMLDRLGRYGVAHNTPRMAWCARTEQGARSGIVFSAVTDRGRTTRSIYWSALPPATIGKKPNSSPSPRRSLS